MTRRTTIVLAAFGVICWLAFLLVSAPATVVAAWLGNVPGIALEVPSGGLWSGRGRLQAEGREVGELRWALSPPALFRGEVLLELEVVGADVVLTAELGHRLVSGRTRVTGIRGDVALALLADITGIERLVDANITVDGVDLRLDRQRLRAAEGTVDLHAVTLIAPRRTLLGRYRMQLSTSADGWMSGRIVDSDGPLTIAGDMGLTSNGDWRLDLRLHTDDPEGDIAQGLAFLGEADTDGGRHVVFSGRL